MPAEERIVSSEAECRDEVELFAYRHVLECGGLDVRIGCVLAYKASQEIASIDQTIGSTELS